MTMHRLLITGVVGLALSLGACDSGEKKGDDKSAKAGGKKADGKKADGKKADGKAADGKSGDAAGDAGGDEADEKFDDRVVKAAGLAKKIEANPDKADEILAEAGTNREEFEALIYEVSRPELAEQYRLAMAES